MRFLGVSFLVLACSLAIFADPSPRVFEDQVNDVIECVRGLLIDGVPEQGIPTFNPLEVESVSEDLGSLGIEGLSGTVNLENLYVAGITDFVQSNLRGSIGLIPPRYTFELTLTFPLTTISTQYDIDVTYTPSDLHVYGAGELGVEAVNFAADVDVTATILGGIAISNFELWVSLESLNSFVLTGWYNDEELSAQIVETVLADPSGFLEQYASTINDYAYDIATGAVNDGLDGDNPLSDALADCI